MAVFHRIHPEPGELSAEEAASSFGPAASAPAERPYLGLNMVATADGKATIDGRSGPIGNKADRELFHELRVTFGVRSVLCEGGPLLNDALLREGLVDELWLVLAPKLAGGAGPTIVTGAALDPPDELGLEWALESGDDHLFLRYRVRGL